MTLAPEKYKPDTEQTRRMVTKINKVLKLLKGMEMQEGFDVLVNAFEALLYEVTPEQKEVILQSLNRFVVIQLMGREEYEATMKEITEMVEAEGDEVEKIIGLPVNPVNQTRH